MADKEREIHVVVVGGSAAGSSFIKKVAPLVDQGYKNLHITLVDKSSHYFHVFGFPRAVVDLEYAEKCFVPFTRMKALGLDSAHSKNRFIQQSLVSVKDTHHIELDDGSEVYFDYLVLATGSKVSRPIKPGETSKEAALSELKALNASVQQAHDILIIGGGPVGIETAGELAHQFPEKEITLVHSGQHALAPNLKIGVRNGAVEKLERIGVKVVLNERILVPDDHIFDNKVKRVAMRGSSGAVYDSDLQLKTTGNTYESQFLEPLEGGASRIRDEKTHEIKVKATLQIDADELAHIFVPGDANNMPYFTKYGFKADMQGATAGENVKSMIKSGFDVDAKAVKLQDWKDPITATMVPVGPQLGVMQVSFVAFGGSCVGDYLVSSVKGKDYMLGKSIAGTYST